MSKQPTYTPEIKERAVRLVVDHEHAHPTRWAAICSVAAKIGCTPETLRGWIKRAERREREPEAVNQAARLKALERENRELRQANEILRKASAFFAQAELDRQLKK